MDKDDRTEVREIIHGIVGGYHAKVDAQNEVTNAALKEIKDRLGKLNGSVSSHEKYIASTRAVWKFVLIIISIAIPIGSILCYIWI